MQCHKYDLDLGCQESMQPQIEVPASRLYLYTTNAMNIPIGNAFHGNIADYTIIWIFY
jgi:hypothetical protein